MRLASALRREMAKTVRRPVRVVNLLRPSKVRPILAAQRKRRRLERDHFAPWAGPEGLKVRAYASYADYVRHQGAKLDEIADLSAYDERFRAALAGRLREHGLVGPRDRVLCLAARLGSEVKAFDDLGCFAVGIDLNPGPENRWVHHGDFHDLRFPDGSADVVFTNSLDHALDPVRALAEVRRVLRPGGLLILECMEGTRSFHTGYYEAFAWERVDDLLGLLGREGFAVVRRGTFDFPWPGHHLCLRPREGP